MNAINPETNRGTSIPYRILNPHYTDSRFKKPQTIYLDPEFKTEIINGSDMVKGAEYLYSDRLIQEHGEEFERAIWKAGENAKKYTPEFYEIYLRTMLGEPALRLLHILSSFNSADGYSYRIYGFIRKDL